MKLTPDIIKLMAEMYEEGYKSAMAVIGQIANDRTQDEVFTKKLEEELSKKFNKYEKPILWEQFNPLEHELNIANEGTE